jgi:hypothetical protein
MRFLTQCLVNSRIFHEAQTTHTFASDYRGRRPSPEVLSQYHVSCTISESRYPPRQYPLYDDSQSPYPQAHLDAMIEDNDSGVPTPRKSFFSHLEVSRQYLFDTTTNSTVLLPFHLKLSTGSPLMRALQIRWNCRFGNLNHSCFRIVKVTGT